MINPMVYENFKKYLYDTFYICQRLGLTDHHQGNSLLFTIYQKKKKKDQKKTYKIKIIK